MAKNAAGADAPSKEEKKAAKVAARAAKKERRGQIWQAFQMQRKQDKRLLPYMIGALVGTTLIVTLALMWFLPWWMVLPFVLAAATLYYLLTYCMSRLMLRQKTMVEEVEIVPSNQTVPTEQKLG